MSGLVPLGLLSLGAGALALLATMRSRRHVGAGPGAAAPHGGDRGDGTGWDSGSEDPGDAGLSAEEAARQRAAEAEVQRLEDALTAEVERGNEARARADAARKQQEDHLAERDGLKEKATNEKQFEFGNQIGSRTAPDDHWGSGEATMETLAYVKNDTRRAELTRDARLASESAEAHLAAAAASDEAAEALAAQLVAARADLDRAGATREPPASSDGDTGPIWSSDDEDDGSPSAWDTSDRAPREGDTPEDPPHDDPSPPPVESDDGSEDDRGLQYNPNDPFL